MKQKIYINLSAEELSKMALEKKEVKRAGNGALVVYTGKYTGRSPKDKYIVDSPGVRANINWGEVNASISVEKFNRLYDKITKYLDNVPEKFIFHGYAGADEKYSLGVKVVSEFAYQALFCGNLFRHSDKDFSLSLTILSAPGCFADPTEDGTNSEVFIALDLERMIILIGGTKYSGEIKKSVFTTLNYMLPERGVLPMHCSANVGANGQSALFFGLSGTGKTTLSAAPDRFLIGDDEHGWSENGIFNFEGGCYAKCINLDREAEPQIWSAIKEGTLLENVSMDEGGKLDFNDNSITENTRAAYPIQYIDNAVLGGITVHPKYVIFLTADAFGVMPPVSKLDTNGAMYHFISGYTSKLAGTERGITEPKATFSECFGAPFMPRPAVEYAKLLADYITRYKSTVYLINTGWTGGPYGIGKRFAIKDTRNIVRAVLNGELDGVTYSKLTPLNLDIPEFVPGVDANILNPENSWSDKDGYAASVNNLAKQFTFNFEKKFSGVDQKIKKAGPYVI